VNFENSGFVRAMAAAVEMTFGFYPVAYDFAAAMSAFGRERMYGALKRIEGMRFTAHVYFEGFVVIVSTYFATCHNSLPP
jgi:hypothetical protein